MNYLRRGILLSLFLAVFLIFFLSLTTPVFADSGTTADNPAQNQEEVISDGAQTEDEAASSQSSGTELPPETGIDSEADVPVDNPEASEQKEVDELNVGDQQGDDQTGENGSAINNLEENSPSETEESEVSSPSSEDGNSSEDTDETMNLAELPVLLSDADLQLVNGNEESLPMGSEAAVESVSVADPYFYVGTTKYSFTHADCDPDTAGDQACSNPIQATLDYIASHGIVPTNRMIYVEDATYTENVTLDGTTSSSLSQIKGLIGQSTAGTILNGNLLVSGTVSGFTLSNFTVNGAVQFDGNKGTLAITDVTQQSASSGTGVAVTNHNGSVNLTRVTATDNSQYGAYIDTTISSGSVSITESVFEENGNAELTAGVRVLSSGSVTLNGISASNNTGSGAYISNFKSLKVSNSLFNNNTCISPVWQSGLFVYTIQTATVTVDTVVANENSGAGTSLTTWGNVSVKNITAEENSGNGLNVCTGLDCTLASAYNVSITNGSFSDNAGSGIAITNRGVASLTGIYSARNDENGISIQSFGNVSLNNVTAYENTIGAYLLTDIEGGKGSVTISNSKGDNEFSGNTQGLVIIARNGITLTGVDAYSNDEFGARLVNITGSSSVSVKDSHFSNNDWYGAEILSRGSVSFQGSASNNGQDLGDLPAEGHAGGLFIDNFSALKALPVTLTYGSFSNNTGGDGLYVQSRGNISLTDIFAYGNGRMGANLHNAGLGGTGTITVKASKTTDRRNMNDNDTYGLFAVSNNSITIMNMDFVDNGSDGAYLDNVDGIKKAVTLTNVDFNDNDSDGLVIFSSGTVKITNINAYSNIEDGVYIENWDGSGSVTIARTEKKWHNYISDNGMSGLRIFANGSVSLYKVMANNNGSNAGISETAFGAFINNCQAVEVEGVYVCSVTGGSVTVKGSADYISTFDNNKSGGLVVLSPGAITVDYVEASDNGPSASEYAPGVYLSNSYDGLSSKITASRISANNNYGDGFSAWSRGTISATNIDAYNNNGMGVMLNNIASLKTVAITGKNINAGNNAEDGLGVNATGAIVLTGINASDNNGYGAYLYNYNAVKAQTVTITDGTFNNNTNGDGLGIYTRGTVKLTDVSANNNDFTDGYLGVSSAYGGTVQETIFDYDNAGSMVDYWRFQISDDTEFTLYLQSNDFTPVLTLYVYNDSTEDWDYLASDSDITDPDGIASFTYTLLAGELYRVSVTSPDADQSGVYVFDIGDGSTPYTDTSSGANGIYVNTEGTVLIKNPNDGRSYSQNASTGLYVFSGGAITLTNVYATMNGNLGASLYVMNSGGITVNGWANGFSNNRSTGIDASAPGVISLTNTDAMGNGSVGANLYNARGIADVKILVNRPNWSNWFADNNGDGLVIGTRGNVTINKINASNNAGVGTFVYNSSASGPLAVKSVKITESQFIDNDSYGLLVYNNGAITVDKITASNNLIDGIHLDNTSHDAGATITATRTTTNYNGEDGLDILSNGKIILDGIIAIGNTGDGLIATNQFAEKVGTITLTNKKGSNVFIGNGADGVELFSNKAITISGLESKQNVGTGIRLISMGGVVSVTNGLFSRNTDGGLYIQTNGFDAILKTVSSYMNGLESNASGLYANITNGNLRLTSSSFYGNGIYGVYANLNSAANLLLSSGTLCFANNSGNYMLP